ncbi:MAG: tRNA lysidine(34) synthetase TilS [Dehalococcoidales bacterium]|nr:tRNA lysidine(34) synthetase TilS [Dehalococcoidales bacterium]
MMKRRGELEPLEQRVLGYIREHHLLSAGDRLVVAVSGGADSVCLLHILVGLRDVLKLKLHIAHLDHRLRGAESEADARYVARLAHQLGIPATIEARDVKSYQAQQGTSLEEAARQVRYTFLTEVVRATEAACVAVGHTTDDHIETVLMHLIRGAGTRGLRGLQPVSQWSDSANSLRIIRPLLKVSRQETADYCLRYGLEPKIDTSNLSLSLLRNRIRLQLLPHLRDYNPRIDEALLRTARIAADDLAYLDKEAARLGAEIAQQQGETIVFDRDEFLELPYALKRHLLRQAIEKLAGDLKDIEACHIEDIMGALNKPAGKKLSLPGGLVFITDYNHYRLAPEQVKPPPSPLGSKQFSLIIPGETVLPGWCVRATIVKPEEMGEKESSFTANLDFDKAGSNLIVRSRRAGDRFQPLGMNQPKKLGRFMIDAKIPGAWRQQVPIVCSPEHILWVVGWRIDERVKVTPDTGWVLNLEFEPASQDLNWSVSQRWA